VKDETFGLITWLRISDKSLKYRCVGVHRAPKKNHCITFVKLFYVVTFAVMTEIY